MSQSSSTFPPALQKGLLFPIFFLNAWLFVLLLEYLQPMFSIFLTAVVLAMVLEFPVRFLQHLGLKRGLSLGLVLLVGLIGIVLLSILLLPTLLNQILELRDLLPSWLDSISGLVDRLSRLPFLQNLEVNWDQLQALATNQLTTLGRAGAGGLVSLLVGSFSGGLTLFFIIVLMIFLLLGGQQAWNGTLRWLPPWWQERLQAEVPLKLRLFIGGQVMIAAGFSVVLAIIFTISRIPLGLLFGFAIGMASMLPFMGAIAQVSVSLIVTLNNIRDGIEVFLIAFVLGQIVDNAVVPRVMGDLVGVNPIWVLISVFLGAKLAGIIGILLAVPVASVVKTIGDDLLAERRAKLATAAAIAVSRPEHVTTDLGTAPTALTDEPVIVESNTQELDATERQTTDSLAPQWAEPESVETQNRHE
ncbi:MAG: AI-2E family transporter [Cyanobacteria bacterium P01_H01_bin.121]